MALLKKWHDMAYSETTDKGTLQKLWTEYFQKERDIYAQLLKNPDEVVKGTVKELAEKYKVDIMTMVGFLDGINDSLPLKQADVGISVDTAVDIAKEVADIILLEKDLNVLDEGVVEGRRTFTNMTKYLKMSVSGNFGNMFSVLIASIFLPFLPMLPLHILVQNILNDLAQLGMPFDHVEDEYIRRPIRWNVRGIRKFMVWFGLLSTLLDILCFLVLWFVFKFNEPSKAGFFQCGWFMFGVITQTVVIHTIRTPKLPFIQDNASKELYFSTALVVLITLLIGFTGIAGLFGLPVMVPAFGGWMALLMLVYMVLASVLLRFYKED